MIGWHVEEQRVVGRKHGAEVRPKRSPRMKVQYLHFLQIVQGWRDDSVGCVVLKSPPIRCRADAFNGVTE
jgi:hypothetical protein